MPKSKLNLLWGIFVVYIIILLRITVFRSDFGTHSLFRDGEILWIPFTSTVKYFKYSFAFFVYIFVGNLVWFVPLGMLLPVLTGCGKRVILYSFLLSLLIELSQFIFGTGVTEVEDLILNTTGGAMGYGILQMILLIREKRT